MAETVGTKTKQKTSAGKDVYKTPEGESVSEKSVTIKFGDEAYVNAPSIHEGKQYTEDEIKEMLLEGVIKPTSRHDTLEEAVKAAETRSDNLLKDGGMALAKQMEMFQDGGLMDEGGTVDPISGNDVPPGSNQEEVRDDIPAQLSEGEFVFPADVVRYFGLEKLMEMRQEAKMGLQRMDDMGQMGNSEEAIIPDNLPFDIDDIDMEDDNEPQEFNLGGVVQQPGSGIGGYIAPTIPTTGFTPLGTAAAPVTPGSLQPQQAATPIVNYGQGNLPTFGNVVGTGGGAYDEMVTYVNSAGQIRQIPHVNGKPIYPVPEGFTKQASPTDVVPDSPLVDTTKQIRNNDGGGDSGNDGGSNSSSSSGSIKVPDFLKGIFDNAETPSGSKTDSFFNVGTLKQQMGDYGFTNSALNKQRAKQSAFQVGSLSALAAIGATALGKATANDMAKAGYTGRSEALSFLGLGDIQQIQTTEQATLLANAMSAAHKARFEKVNVLDAVRDVLTTEEGKKAQRASVESLKNRFVGPDGTLQDLSDTLSSLAQGFKEDLSLLTGLNDDGTVTPTSRSTYVTDGQGKPVTTGGYNGIPKGFAYSGSGLAEKNKLTATVNRLVAGDKRVNGIMYEDGTGGLSPNASGTPMSGVGRDPMADVGNNMMDGLGSDPMANVGNNMMDGLGSDPMGSVGNNMMDGLGRDPMGNVGDDMMSGIGDPMASVGNDMLAGLGDPNYDPTYGTGDNMMDGLGVTPESRYSDRGNDSDDDGGGGGGSTDNSYNQDDVLGPDDTYDDDFDIDDTKNKSDDTGNTDGGDTGCFITTAIVEKKGEADDGETLTKLRKFRNEYMADKQEEVQEYYEIAPKIVEAINDKKEWKWIEEQIQKAVDYIDEEKHDDAYTTYKSMVSTLKEKWLV